MPGICLPTVHLASVLHGGKPINEVIAADLGKAWQIANEGVTHKEYIVHVIPGNPIGIQTAFDTAIQYMRWWRWRGSRLGVDVETSALDYFNCKLYSIALGDAESGVAISFTLLDFHTLPPSYEIALVEELRAVLGDPAVGKVLHNAPFDLAVLHRKGFQVNGAIWDTQGLHHLVQPDIPHDLGWIGQTYLQVEPWKLDHDSGKMANTRDPVKLLVYNARDALYTAMLVEPLLEDIERRGMSANLAAWQAAYARLATSMEICGIPINFAKRKKMGQALKQKMGQTRQWMREFLNWPEFNPMADEHRRVALFSSKYAGAPWNLGLQSTKLTEKTSKASTSYKAIIDYLEHPFVKALADYIDSRMTYATQYRDGTELDLDGKPEEPGSYQKAICSDGRIHPRWKPNTLRSVRWASEPNVQNQRKNDRAFFEAPDGWVFVGADKDQLELRIKACQAGQRELLTEMARPGGDPHRLAAMNVYGDQFLSKPKDDQKLLRDIVKNVVYAALYLAGWMTVWRTVRERKLLKADIRAAMTKGVVKHVHTSYFMQYSEIRRHSEWLVDQANTVGYIEIPPFGRRRYCPVRPVEATEISNWGTQCYQADALVHTKEGLIPIIECDRVLIDVPIGGQALAHLIPRGQAEFIDVELDDGSPPLHVTPDHRWLCKTNEEYTYKRASELAIGDLICTPLPAGQDEPSLRADELKPWQYWMGAIISDGSTSEYQYQTVFGNTKNNRLQTLAKEYYEFAESRGWEPNHPEVVKANLLRVKLGQGVCTGHKRFAEDMEAWGYTRSWTCYTKRVPREVWRSSKHGILMFLKGMLEADGTQTSGEGRTKRSSLYNFHSSNKALLEDLLRLFNYCNVKCTLRGPYHPGPKLEYISWQLYLHPYDVERAIFPERLASKARLRITREDTGVPLAARDAFLKKVSLRDLHRESFKTLWHRLATGGQTSPWTLREMYRDAGAQPDPLYGCKCVKRVLPPATAQSMCYTLSVDHPLHQYTAEGTVTKNCPGAEYVTAEGVMIEDEQTRRFPGEAFLCEHIHDQLISLCTVRVAEQVADIYRRVFGASYFDGPAGPVLLTSRPKIGKTLMDVK
jgi:DNA polymerase I-like protein with 3'-5' exonuclease and polymerase domains